MGSDLAMNPPPPPPIHIQVKALVDRNTELGKAVGAQRQEIKELKQLIKMSDTVIAAQQRRIAELEADNA